MQLYSRLKRDRDVGAKLKGLVRRRGGLEVHSGMSDSSAEGTTHSVRVEEQVAFANWINRCFCLFLQHVLVCPLQSGMFVGYV